MREPLDAAPPTPLTEDDLVATIRRVVAGDAPGVLLGVGDDAALVEAGRPGSVVILTTDALVEGVHFDRSGTSPRDLGHKAVAVNVSDVAAMGGGPLYALVALAVPPTVEPAWIVDLYGGMRAACESYGCSLVGGDLSRSSEIFVSVTVLGEVAAGRAVRRSGARPGDAIVVTGVLGAAAGGLVLARASAPVAADAASAGWGHDLLVALDRPEARVGEGETLAQAGATAMIDLSDGLARDLGRLCAESRVGARVRLADVPVADQLERLAVAVPGVDPLTLALSGGEDYELLATLPAGAVEDAAASLIERFGVPLRAIGEIVEDGGLVALEPDGRERPLMPEGWDHFA